MVDRQPLVSRLETLGQCLVAVRTAEHNRGVYMKVNPRKRLTPLLTKWSLKSAPPPFVWFFAAVVGYLALFGAASPLVKVLAVMVTVPVFYVLYNTVLVPVLNRIVKWSNGRAARKNAVLDRFDADCQGKYQQLANYYRSIGGPNFYPQAYLSPIVVNFVKTRIENHLAGSVSEGLRQWEAHLRQDEAARRAHAQTQLLKAIDLELAFQNWTR